MHYVITVNDSGLMAVEGDAPRQRLYANMMTTLTAARVAMRALHRAPEPEVLAGLLPAATLDKRTREAVVGRALGLLADLRAAQSEGWVNRFLQQYRLNTAEEIGRAHV